MWYTKALVAYDGSPASVKALDVAREMSTHHPDIEFVFVHVLKLYAGMPGAGSLDQALLDSAEQLSRDLNEAVSSMEGSHRVLMLKGSSPAELLLKCAAEENCDLIIMGSRGKGGVKGYLGSVSYAVVQKARACVLIAKGE